MHHSPKVIPSILALGALALAGCGSFSDASSTAARTLPAIALKGVGFAGNAIPARYTCDGGDVSPALEWGAVPPSTRSLFVDVIGVTPQAATKSYSLTLEWGVGGLSPALHRLAAGRLPAGAVVAVDGAHGAHYSICPARGATVRYQVEIWGLPGVMSSKFDAIPLVSALESTNSSATAHGIFIASYNSVPGPR